MTQKNRFDLSGKVSLITGAGGGLGRAFCEAMAENGSDIVCADINQVQAEETADLVAKNRVKTLVIKADVSNQDDVKAMFQRVDQEFGKLDILFNNAGLTTRPALLHEMPLEDWTRVISVDLTGVFFCMQEGIKLMLRQKRGSIINIASIAGLVAYPNKCNYAAAKAGVISLTKSAALDYGPDGIRINVIAPGFFGETELSASAGYTGGELQELWTTMAKKAPLRRIGQPAEIKELALYLASDASSFVTGDTFVIDGGFILG